MTTISSPFQRLVNRKVLFRLYLLRNLPMAFIAGVKVQKLNPQMAVTSIRFGWLTQNPFRSMYFACQAMAAEMATGMVVLDQVYGHQPAVSMLIVKNEAVYHKKATGKVIFTCRPENLIVEALAQAAKSGEGVELRLPATGVDENGNPISDFVFTWSLKLKAK